MRLGLVAHAAFTNPVCMAALHSRAQCIVKSCTSASDGLAACRVSRQPSLALTQPTARQRQE